MSMWLSLCRVDEEVFTVLKTNSDLIEALFFDDDLPASLANITEDDLIGVDWLTMSAVYTQLAEFEGEEVSEDILTEDLGTTHEMDFDAGYGPAFYIEPSDVEHAMASSQIPYMESEYKDFFQTAQTRKMYIVGIIS